MKSKLLPLLVPVLLATTLVASASAANTRALNSLPTAWPDSGLAKFIFENLDLTTFRNSTGPRRRLGQLFFKDLGIRLGEVTEQSAVSDDPEFTYVVEVLAQRDYTKSGVKDVAICFSESANGGTYRDSHPYLVQLLEGRVVALAYDIASEPEAQSCNSP
jgi:hypothetical protein